MCWVSGPLAGDDGSLESWTAHKDREFVVDLVGDVENRLPEQSVFEPRALIDGWGGTGDLPPHLIPFRTLREAVDYTFATNPRVLDESSGGNNDGTVVDLRLERLREVLGGMTITEADWKLERALPWLTSDQYFKAPAGGDPVGGQDQGLPGPVVGPGESGGRSLDQYCLNDKGYGGAGRGPGGGDYQSARGR